MIHQIATFIGACLLILVGCFAIAVVAGLCFGIMSKVWEWVEEL